MDFQPLALKELIALYFSKYHKKHASLMKHLGRLQANMMAPENDFFVHVNKELF